MTIKIHLIFKTHLDVGFTDYASVVTHNYFKKYIPTALGVARELRETNSTDRFIWTTGSWLIYEYLEQASSRERQAMEESIMVGDISWHALPFTTHTELMDAELFRFGLSLSARLDSRFGRHTTAAKMTDVPGHTRAIIPYLADRGITFLHLGVNPASPVPGVPGLFRWVDPNGSEITVMYESGYGNAFDIPGSDHSLAFGHTMDNMGPQSTAQVLDVFKEIRARFPGAEVFASTLSDFAQQLACVSARLPVVTSEIGDTWIHGIGSDPIKVSRYRELLRLRKEWLLSGRINPEEPAFINFNRKLLLVPEHTWGMDEKTFLGDHENYSAESFAAARAQQSFKKFEYSWVEKRSYPQQAVNALEDHLLAAEARQRLALIRPQKPDVESYKKANTDIAMESAQLRCVIDHDSGNIVTLTNTKTGFKWAHPHHPFSGIHYQTFSASDYVNFFSSYTLPQHRHGWAEEDFTKPGLRIEDCESKTWHPVTRQVSIPVDSHQQEVLIHSTFPAEALTRYGAPAEVFTRIHLCQGVAGVFFDVQWFRKAATRLPEAIWYSFQPRVPAGGKWFIEKLGHEISPLDVVENGNRHLHACGESIIYRSPSAALQINPLDSPLVAPGHPALLKFDNILPELEGGMHFCLFNNLWGTNFPMWFEEDCRFRFILKLQATKKEIL